MVRLVVGRAQLLYLGPDVLVGDRDRFLVGGRAFRRFLRRLCDPGPVVLNPL